MKHKNCTLGVFSGGFLSGGICPGGFCPRTAQHSKFLVNELKRGTDQDKTSMNSDLYCSTSFCIIVYWSDKFKTSRESPQKLNFTV